MNTKQVIVMRKDLKMRRGKENAQAAHSSLAFLTRRLLSIGKTKSNGEQEFSIVLSKTEQEWLNNSFAKITLQIDSEEELLGLYNLAKEAGIEVHKVIDAGRTQFNGVPTLTCICLGPDYAEKIDKVTGHLKLY